MPEVLVKFDEPIRIESGDTYFAQAVGKEVSGGLWEGWLEFLPRDEGPETIETRRETTQPNRTNLEYWAQGLTKVYLEGALARAISLAAGSSDTRTDAGDDDFPAFPARRGPLNPRTAPLSPRPILDPFQVYAQGESVLRSELGALSRVHLEAIATAYNLPPRGSSAANAASTSAIINAIVEGVRTTQ